MTLIVGRVATTFLFLNLGFVVGIWVSSIPDVKEAFKLNGSELGLMIFLSGIGAGGMAFPFGWAIDKFGPQAIIYCSFVVSQLLYMWLPKVAEAGLKPYPYVFLLSIVSAGGGIAINTRASEVEALWGSPIMSSFHAAFSLGGVVGSAVYATLLKMGLTWPAAYPMLCLFAACVAFTAASFMNSGVDRSLIEREPTTPASPSSWHSYIDVVVLCLGCVNFLAMMTEGAIGDWTSLYFQEVARTPPYLAPLGYTSFACAMSSMRFVGDPIIRKFGRRNVFRAGGALAFTGLAIMLSFPNFNTDLVALVFVGCGMSNMVPILMSTSAARGGRDGPGLAIATVSVMGQVGLLAGPCVIGFLADFTGTLRVALCTLLVATTLIMAGARLVVEMKPLPTSSDDCPIEILIAAGEEGEGAAAEECSAVPYCAYEELGEAGGGGGSTRAPSLVAVQK